MICNIMNQLVLSFARVHGCLPTMPKRMQRPRIFPPGLPVSPMQAAVAPGQYYGFHVFYFGTRESDHVSETPQLSGQIPHVILGR